MSQPIVIVKQYGISAIWMLTIIFVVAKIWGKLDWSWAMVFIPIWGPVALVLGGMLLMMLFVFILDWVSQR